MIARGETGREDELLGLEKWLELNTKYSAEWPNITVKGDAPADAEAMNGVENKLDQFFSPEPGKGD